MAFVTTLIIACAAFFIGAFCGAMAGVFYALGRLKDESDA